MITTAFKSRQEYETHILHPELNIYTIDADDAPKSVEHFCTFCGTPMYPKTSVNGVNFFACKPRCQHTKKICESLAKKTYIVKVSEINPESFFNGLIFPTVAPTKTTIGPGGMGGGRVTPPTPPPTTISVRAASAIRDLINQGLERRPHDTIINHDANVMIHDILMAVPSHDMLFSDLAILNKQKRVVEMRPMFRNNSTQTIICCAFHRSEDEVLQYIYFYLSFQDRADYTKALEDLFHKEEQDDGNLKTVRSYDSIFVAAEWSLSEEKHEFNENSWPIFTTTITRRLLQICAPSNYKVKEKKADEK